MPVRHRKPPGSYGRGRVTRNRGYYLEWHGDALARWYAQMSLVALEYILQECVFLAKRYAPYDTGALMRSIRYWMRDKQSGGRGTFGSTLHYAVFQEEGTRFMVGRFYLRRAADEVFPRLAPEIRRRLAS